MDFLIPLFRESVFGFFALFVLVKLLGKTQITQLTPFDFVAALVLGELVGSALFDDNTGIIKIGFAVLIWGIMIYITEIITQKFKGTRGLLEGRPTIIIHQGKLIKEEMKESKLDVNQLQHMLRSKGVFSMKEVEYAILETDGSVSVLKKSDYQPPTKKDLNVKSEPVQLPITLVNDGEIIRDNLKEAKLTEKWLENKLEEQGVDTVRDVFYAEWVEGENLFILPFTKRKS